MPNYCENEIRIYGKEKELRKWKKECTDKKGKPSLNLIAPTGEDYPSCNEACETWGTKWDMQDIQESEWVPEDEMLCYHFLSAWSPPVEAFITNAKKYKNLRYALIYREDGNCYMGVAEMRDGELYRDDYIEWGQNVKSNNT